MKKKKKNRNKTRETKNTKNNSYAITESVISKKYLYHILGHKKYCYYQKA